MSPSAEANPRTAAHTARPILERIFRDAKPGIRCRLWDGSEVCVGSPLASFTLTVNGPDAFRRCFGSGNTRAMAECFVERGLDVEGDLFDALRVANQLEDLSLDWIDRLSIWIDAQRI